MGKDSGPVVLYDGVCALCTASVRFILQHERKPELRFAPLDSDAGRHLMRLGGIDPETTDSVVLIERGKAFIEGRAAAGIAAYLRRPWCWARMLRFVPSPLRDRLYRLIARQRYRWFGQLDREWSPPQGLEERFL